MAKRYTLITDKQGVEDAQRTIEIAEDRTETKKERTSLGQLRHEYEKLQSYIQNAAIEADALVDEMTAIKTELSMKITVPDKMQGSDTIQVPVRKEDEQVDPIVE